MNLTTFCPNAASLYVIEHDSAGHGWPKGTAATYFGDELALLQVGDAQGEDAGRGAYEWYPLTVRGETAGELRDDASGMTIHVEA